MSCRIVGGGFANQGAGPPRNGIVAALNTGLAAARGEFIARMDGDDISRPERFAEQVAFLRCHPEVGLVGCRVEFAGDRQRQAGYAAYVDWQNSLVDSGEISLNRFIESPFAHPSVMFRRSLPERFGGYRQGPFPEDYELWLRWLEAGVWMAKCPRSLLVWRDSPGRASRVDQRYHPRAFFGCKIKYLAGWLQQKNPFHPRVLIWGAGRETRRRIEPLTDHGIQITAYIDIDPRKIGQVIHGRPVLAAEQLPSVDSAFIVVCVSSRGARDDIRHRLCDRGYREGRKFMVAG